MFFSCILSFMKIFFSFSVLLLFFFVICEHTITCVFLFLKIFPFSYHCRQKGNTCSLFCTPTLLASPEFAHTFKKNDGIDLASILEVMMSTFIFCTRTRFLAFCCCFWSVPLAEKLVSHCSVIPVLLLLLLLSSLHSPVIVALSYINPTFLSRVLEQPHSLTILLTFH